MTLPRAGKKKQSRKRDLLMGLSIGDAFHISEVLDLLRTNKTDFWAVLSLFGLETDLFV